MKSAFLVLIVAAIGLTASACHESGGAPEVKADFTDGLALSCEDNRTCAEGVCDLATLACVGCLVDSDCAAGRCHPRDHVCVQCTGDADCDGGFCHPTQAVCVGCFDDAQCQRVGGRGVCHPDTLACVECTADQDCAGGRCNPATFACIGQCTVDSQCADRNPCTDERCDSGACTFTPVADTVSCDDGLACTSRDHCQAGTCVGEATSACCAPLVCQPDEVMLDSDRDGCNDTCECPSAPACPLGTTPHDQTGGGCDDQCVCPSGAVIGPAGECPCTLGITCEGGLVPSDLDGDNCPETCAKPCQTNCDCTAQGLVAATPCALACANCGAFLECVAGACVGRCGVAPADDTCECPAAPICAPRETAFDSDNDGCNDACRCLVDGPNGCACPTTVTCGPGSSPSDGDRDGCDDTCVCDDPTRVQSTDGRCCPDLACPSGQVAVDVQGDTCPDACVCEGGGDPSFAVPVCPCKALECPTGSAPTDTDPNDGDDCADACVCPDGLTPGPAGCGTCLADCAGRELPAWRYFVDDDQDTCYDVAAECPVGQTAATSPGAGCPDFCTPCPALECPSGARGNDSDGDRCPDQCVCDDFAPAPTGGCGCPNEVVCSATEVPVDIDRDGCVDTCRTACVTACDCAQAVLVGACDCVDCRVGASCIDGFCAGSCGAVAPCATAASDDEVCGCDGKTYPSRCEAAVASVDIVRAGACSAGCTADSDCGDGERCEGTRLGCDLLVAVDSARCVAVPTSCLPAADPMCGCDGKTYPNDCERRRANVALAAQGSCPNTPD